jgi:hypothetical protein
MAFRRTRDLLDLIIDIHQSISTHYNAMEEKASGPGLMDKWFQYTPDESSVKGLSAFEIYSDTEIPEIIEMALILIGEPGMRLYRLGIQFPVPRPVEYQGECHGRGYQIG